jgi:alpha-ketoglutarate-dependent taurine dioxygenase
MSAAGNFEVSPLDATFGAIVTGLRLVDLDHATFARLYAIWLEHALLIFPDQHLTRSDQVAFARRFGNLEFEIAPISNVRSDGTLRTSDENDDMMKILKGNMHWHADSTYMPVQAKGAVFTAHVVPSSAGETGWADMRAAYDQLDVDRRDRLAGLSAHHSLHFSQARAGQTPSNDGAYGGYGLHDGDPPLRPLVKIHPETGRPSLLIGRHAYGIPGMDPAESEQFLQELVDDACQAPRTYHHAWSAGDAVLWDNRCLLHRARPWNMHEPRVMYHSRIAGDPATESGIPAA